MVRLQIWQKRTLLLARKRRKKWQDRHPKKIYPTLDPFVASIGTYTCAMCGEMYYYLITQKDRDAPQYHKHKNVWMVICHACWHLKGIYEKHQDPKSAEGLSGCRFCHLQLAAKRNSKRSKEPRQEESFTFETRPRQAESSTADWEPTRVRRSVGLSAGRNGGANSKRKRPAGRGTR